MVTFRLPLALAALFALAGPATAGATAAPLLNPLFQDHAVLQRERTLPVWGEAAPGARLTVSLAGRSVHGRADAAGRWRVELPALAAGGPYVLEARTAEGRVQRVADVLVGDVWLCAGQSNMVLPVARALDAWNETHAAPNDRIRMLTVANVASATPLERLPAGGHWLPATPEHVPDFSALCYFHARELQRQLDVPMGLVVAAWGGSRIEPWLSEAALRKVGGYGPGLDLLAAYRSDPAAAGQAWDRQWKDWWLASTPGDAGHPPWQAPAPGASDWPRAPLERGPWQAWGQPELANFTGMLWYRSTLTLSPEQAALAAQGARLALLANEIDQTWVNGHWVGTAYGSVQRDYAIPPGVLHAGSNQVVVNVLNTWRNGGVQGDAQTRAIVLGDGRRLVLEDWQYRVVPSGHPWPPNLPWQSTAGLGTLHNGMLAPLGDYAFRAVLWYQGESNTGDAGHYQALLESLRADLRARFGARLPFLVVQLSSYGPAPIAPAESGWAEVREAQRRVAAEDPDSGLAVAIDIGERDDIHPANKQALARRLARVSRHVVYGEPDRGPSGPVARAAVRRGAAIAVTFGDIDGWLVAWSHPQPIGFELCGAGRASCRYANARIAGTEVLLEAPLAPESVTRVRYCWSESPICTLYDRTGLPAGPFEIPVTSASPH